MADDRKKDHIDLAFEANSFRQSRDSRFEYDPLHGIHPTHQDIMPIEFGNCKMKFPIWISSMTGGTDKAKDININLAKACNDCHSNNSKYPWYANFQPVHWWLEDHIKDGKKHLNFDEYTHKSL